MPRKKNKAMVLETPVLTRHLEEDYEIDDDLWACEGWIKFLFGRLPRKISLSASSEAVLNATEIGIKNLGNQGVWVLDGQAYGAYPPLEMYIKQFLIAGHKAIWVTCYEITYVYE